MKFNVCRAFLLGRIKQWYKNTEIIIRVFHSVDAESENERRAAFDISLTNTMLGSFATTRGFIDALCRSGVLNQLALWATRARNKLTAAIRAFSTKHGFNTRNAERALERTDSRFRRIWREVFVAALAVWT